MVFSLRAIFAFCLLALAAQPALAAPGPAERETARSLMIEGDRLRNAGELLPALAHYQSAHALMHVPTTGLAVAETQAQLGMLVEARSAALDVLSMRVTDADPAVFAAARDAAAVLATALEPRVCTLQTNVRPGGTPYTLQIDDVVLPTAANNVPFKLNPGVHTVRVRALGYRELTRKLTLREGAMQQLVVELIPERPKAAEPAVGPALTHVSSGQAAYSAQLDGERRSGLVRGLIGLGIGGIALGAGGVTGVMSLKQTAEIKQHCGPDFACDAAQRGALSRANTLGNVANIGVPLGVLGLAYGLYELLTLPAAARERSQAALRVDIAPDAIVLRGAL